MIKINEIYYIDADSRCYILKEKGKIQDESSENYDKDIYKDLGYFSTIDMAIQEIFRNEIRKYISNETINSLNELKNFIIKLKDEIKINN